MEHERIICVLEYLSRYSDENHYVSIKDIQNYVANTGTLSYPAEVTIRRDIDRLTSMGNNIVKKSRDHILPNMKHNLNVMCDHYGIALDHHKADSDAHACAEILLRYMESGVDVSGYVKKFVLSP